MILLNGHSCLALSPQIWRHCLQRGFDSVIKPKVRRYELPVQKLQFLPKPGHFGVTAIDTPQSTPSELRKQGGSEVAAPSKVAREEANSVRSIFAWLPVCFTSDNLGTRIELDHAPRRNVRRQRNSFELGHAPRRNVRRQRNSCVPLPPEQLNPVRPYPLHTCTYAEMARGIQMYEKRAASCKRLD